ncbi:MAG: DNA-protecting protein DprA [Candidatus Omnitrophica bacterium]|nr:DNA-protecting protein DprA [Candidatus Omnitrophota bacterium]
MTEREWLIALNMIPEIRPRTVTRLLEAFGSTEGIFKAPEEHLRQVEGITPKLAAVLIAYGRREAAVAEETRRAEAAGCAMVTRLDEEFPETLRNIPDPPPVLYVKGNWVPEDAVAVAIVGSRRASLYGQQTAQRLGYELASRGVTVVSGFARGIDAAAHRGALQAHGRTLAVWGSGLDELYPPEHGELADQIVQHGALISEYPMGSLPIAYHFPQRNRLISGLSLGVVVVEAAHRSGALITVDCALEQGREVFAVPGNIDALTSQGTHHLLKQGARLVTSVDDILEELRLEPIRSSGTIEREAQPHGDWSEEEQQLLSKIRRDAPLDIETLAGATGLPPSRCIASLLHLELKHAVKQLPGQRFVRT